jgi:hypothetical protein
MQYKGEDLDLRVPQTRVTRETYAMLDPEPATNNGRWRSALSMTSGDPVWVDETLLACCNTAFDMALAHGAAEVGLEHLVNAFTRVDAASRILEARGIREAQLRRESAALIASDTSSVPPGERPPPRRSVDLEDTLRRAAEAALRRGAVAGVEDTLWVLLNSPRDVPAIALLRRLVPDWHRPETTRVRDVTIGAPEYRPQPVMPFDSVGARIGVIEDGLRTLHSELQADRKMLIELIRDIQRDVGAQRVEIERAVQTVSSSDGGRTPAMLAERMQTLEGAVRGGLGEGARNWAALTQHLQKVEKVVAAAGAQDVQPALHERLATIERLVETGAGDGGRRWADLSERLGQIETLLAHRADVASGQAALAERLTALERAVQSGLGGAGSLASTLMERFGAIEQTLRQPSRDNADAALLIDERLDTLERLIERRTDETNGRSAEIIDRLKHLDGGLDRLSLPQAALPSPEQFAEPVIARFAGLEHQSDQRHSQMKDELAVLAATVTTLGDARRSDIAALTEAMSARDRELDAIHEAMARLSENQITLASAISDWRHATRVDLGAINTQLERLIPTSTAAAARVASVESTPPAVTVDAKDYTFRKTPPAGGSRMRRFWVWLFGTDNVRQANREASLRWQDMHRALKEKGKPKNGP